MVEYLFSGVLSLPSSVLLHTSPLRILSHGPVSFSFIFPFSHRLDFLFLQQHYRPSIPSILTMDGDPCLILTIDPFRRYLIHVLCIWASPVLNLRYPPLDLWSLVFASLTVSFVDRYRRVLCGIWYMGNTFVIYWWLEIYMKGIMHWYVITWIA